MVKPAPCGASKRARVEPSTLAPTATSKAVANGAEHPNGKRKPRQSKSQKGKGKLVEDARSAERSTITTRPKKTTPGSSRIFLPFRALGFVSNGIPFALQVRHGGKDATTPDVNIITCIEGASSSSSAAGSSSSSTSPGSADTWAMWDAMAMRLLFVGPPAPPLADGGGRIVAMATITSPDSLLVCYSGGSIRRFVRARQVAAYYTWRRRKPEGPRSEEEGSSEEESSDEESSDEDNEGGNLLYPSENLASTPTPLSRMVVFGDTLCATSADGKSIFVWNILTTELLRRIDIDEASSISGTGNNNSIAQSNGTSQRKITALLHPATYLNKILVGFSDASLRLWNVRTGQLIHHFDGPSDLFPHANPSFASNSQTHAGMEVVSLTQSPAIDIIAIGFSSGHVLLHDVRLDEPVFRMNISSSATTSGVAASGLGGDSEEGLQAGVLSRDAITFRTDGKQHTLAIGGTSGNITIFVLEDSATNGSAAAQKEGSQQARVRARPARLSHVIRGAHDAPVGGLHFVPGQPLLISSSADNSYKQWFFEDNGEGGGILGDGSAAAAGGSTMSSFPRLLRSRSGHHAPPHLIRHYGDDGKNILTASRDRSVRCLSVVRDSRSFELSQGECSA